MMLFAFIGALLLVAAMLFVLIPIWRNRTPIEGSRKEANIALYRQHIEELEQEVEAGRLTEADAQQQRRDLAARLLEDVDSIESKSWHQDTKGAWLASVAVVAGFLVISIGVYSHVGDIRGLGGDQERYEITQTMAKLESQLRKHPDDLRSRALLAQIQMAQQDFGSAAVTLHEINIRLEVPVVAFLMGEARALIIGHQGEVTQRARYLIEETLVFEPDNPEALWYGGLAAAVTDGQEHLAIERWQHLLEQDIEDDFRSHVESRLAELTGQKPKLGQSQQK